MDAVVSKHRAAPVAAQPFLAADVGGTRARVALVAPGNGHGPEVLAYRTYACADFPRLSDLLRSFIRDNSTTAVRSCVLACAGQVVGDTVLNDNLAWPVSLAELRESLALDDVAALNDFEALGHALDGADDPGSELLCGPDAHGEGPILIIGPGSGLGAAVRLPEPLHARVLTSEAGQMDFAPSSERERDILDRLAPRCGYVPYERILSGPGLLTLYAVLCGLHGTAPRLTSPEAITAAAMGQRDGVAAETVDVFCAALGSFTGNLAMTFMAIGGVYLAGGFLPAIYGLLRKSSFVDRFLNKGSMRALLSRIPVRVIEQGRHGVLGAARWYLDGCSSGRPKRAFAVDGGVSG